MLFNFKTIIAAILASLLVYLCFSTTLQEFLFSDDSFNFRIYNSLAIANPDITLSEVAADENAKWMEQGRFTPLSFFWQCGVFMNIPSVAAYRWFILFMNFVGMLSFLAFLKLLDFKISYSLWVVCFCAVLQFRIQYHDAYTSLHGMYQLLAVFIFCSLSFHILFLKYRKWIYLTLSLVCYFAAHFHSEVGLAALVFVPALGLLVLRQPLKQVIINALPYVLISGVYLCIVAWLKLHVENTSTIYPGIKSNFAVEEMWSLFLRQTFASVPFSNLYRQIAIPEILLHQSRLWPVTTAMITLVSITLLWVAIPKTQVARGSLKIYHLIFLLLLTIVPAIFILPSLKYQVELSMGVGYLPVYLQNFGCATLLAYLVNFLAAQKHQLYKIGYYLINAILVIAATVSFLFNAALINANICENSLPEIAQYYSLREGILKDVPANSTIIIPKLWNVSWVYNKILPSIYKQRFVAISQIDYHPLVSDSAKQNCYLLETIVGSPTYTKLYAADCNTLGRGQMILVKEYPNTAYQTELEKQILHRLFIP